MNRNYDEQIDRALRVLGSVTPEPGMQDRLHRRLQARLAVEPVTAARFFRLPQLVAGFAAAAIASAVIIAGSVSHSRHMLPVAPGLNLPGNTQPGVGAASAAHIASQPVTALPQDRPRSIRKTTNGRAIIAPGARKPSGVAVPKAPASDQ